ncbi:MAG: redoxin domain-containing protein [Phycisphaerae bacterium]
MGGPLQHPENVASVAFGPDSRMVVTACYDGMVRIWRIARGNRLHTLPHSADVRCVAFSPDSRTVATGTGIWDSPGRRDKAWLWDAATGERTGATFGPLDSVHGVAFSPDGNTVFVAGLLDKVVKWFDAKTGEQIGCTSRHDARIGKMALSPDGRVLLTGGHTRIARLWSAVTGEPIGEPLRHGRYVLGLAFTPDSKVALTGSHDETVGRWDTATGRPLGPPVQLGEQVWALAVSPDGRTVLTGGAARTARLWDATTWKPIGFPIEHPGSIRSVAFGPSGHVIVICGIDGTARIWHAATGMPIGPSLHHGGPGWKATCSPDGKMVATASEDGTAKLWAMPTPAPGEPEKVSLWAQIMTGMALDDWGAVRVLDPNAWRMSRIAFEDALGTGPGDYHRLVSGIAEDDRTNDRVRTVRGLLWLRVEMVPELSSESRRQTVSAAESYLTANGADGLAENDIVLAQSLAQALERVGETELAVKACTTFAEIIGKSRRAKLAAKADMLRGAARRLALVGKRLEFKHTRTGTDTFDWSTYRGKVVLINFRNPMHPGGRTELGAIKRCYERYQDRGFEVVEISLARDRGALDKLLETERVPWVILGAVGAGRAHPMVTHYGVFRPTTLLLNREGTIVSLRAQGPELDKLLGELIGPPYAPTGELTYIDLTSKANRRLMERMDGSPGNDLRELPQDVKPFGGVKFKITDGLMHLAGESFPDEVKRIDGIPVGRTFRRLYLLQASARSVRTTDGMTIARYYVYYDGAVEEVLVVYGEDLRDWWSIDGGKPVTRGLLVWEGNNPAARQKDKTLRLYLTMWENPFPDKKVLSIDYVSAMAPAAPFCVAMTIEQATTDKQVPKSERTPDNSAKGTSLPARP